MIDIASAAETVDEAARAAREIPQFTQSGPLGVAEAYAIQAASVERRLRRGETLVGVKMGLTSRAKMAQVGVDEVIWGRLTDAMRLEDGGACDLARYVHPRIEPELAFLLKRDLECEMTAPQALACVEAIAPAMELIDSRYRDFKFTLPDVIADNSSSSGFVLGPWASAGIDFGNLGLTMEVNGRIVEVGSTAAILGHPARSLVAAARLAAAALGGLKAGWIVLAGGATTAYALKAGDSVRTSMQRVGAVTLRVSQ